MEVAPSTTSWFARSSCALYSAANAGLAAFVLSAEFTDKLDSVLVRMLRYLMHGKAKNEYEGR
eukprot:9134317-Pyramimonas_sp.AAC.1